jgi:Fe-S-cluster-containing hydrogenase component 2
VPLCRKLSIDRIMYRLVFVAVCAIFEEPVCSLTFAPEARVIHATRPTPCSQCFACLICIMRCPINAFTWQSGTARIVAPVAIFCRLNTTGHQNGFVQEIQGCTFAQTTRSSWPRS